MSEKDLDRRISHFYLPEDGLVDALIHDLVFQISQEIILVVDIDSKIIAVNPHMQSFSCYSDHELKGLNCVQLLSPQNSADNFNTALINCMREELDFGTRICSLKTKLGKVFDIEWRNSPIKDEESNIIASLLIGRELGKRSDNLASWVKIQKYNFLKSLAAGIAHIINNKLNAILGYAELLKLDDNGQTSVSKRAQVIIDKVQEAGMIVDDVLMFSQQGMIKKEAVGLKHFSDELIMAVKEFLPAKVQLSINLISDLPCLHVDHSQIKRVLINLVKNSIQAMRNNIGTINISADLLQYSSNTQDQQYDLSAGEYVKIVVEDNGTGIEDDHIEHIFDPFFTTKSRSSNNGMGLSSAYGIVKRHGGDICFKSRVNEGTSCEILLPVARDIVKSDQSDQEILTPKVKKILFVDDEPAVAELQEDILKYFGYDVCAFQDPRDLLDKFQQSPYDFDMIITDMDMPFMNGTDLVKAVRNMNSTIPIIMCTGYDANFMKLEFDKIKELGIDDFMFKPLGLQEINKQILKVFSDKEAQKQIK